MKLIRVFVLGAFGLVLVTGCSEGGATSSAPTSQSSTPPETSSTPSTTDEPSDPASEYTEEEQQAFDDAVARWQQYQEDSEPIWAAGKATPDAEKLFRDYYVPWQRIFNLLQRYEAGEIRIKGVMQLLYAKPTLIKVDNKGGGTVVFRGCVDYAGTNIFQGGEEVSGGADEPQWVRVEMGGYTDEGPDPRWLILTESNPKGQTPCPADEQ